MKKREASERNLHIMKNVNKGLNISSFSMASQIHRQATVYKHLLDLQPPKSWEEN